MTGNCDVDAGRRLQTAFRTALLPVLLIFVLAACGGGKQAGGSLAVKVIGLAGQADMTVTGPGSYERKLDGPATLSGLIAGTYMVEARDVPGYGVATGSRNQTAPVRSGETTEVIVTYVAEAEPAPDAETGTLEVSISGLPAGTDADIVVTGPGGFSRTLSGSGSLTGLALGDYTVTAAPTGGFFPIGNPEMNVTVEAETTSKADFEYARLFEFTASTTSGSVWLGKQLTLKAEVTDLHPDLDAGVSVTLNAAPGWTTPESAWTSNDSATRSLTLVDDGTATLGPNEFSFDISVSIRGQARSARVPLTVTLEPVVWDGSDAASPVPGSLRWLLEDNATRVVGHEITFADPAIFGTPPEINIVRPLEIGYSVDITGFEADGDRLAITPNVPHDFRLFHVTGSDTRVSLDTFTFGAGGAGATGDGGAIRNEAELHVSNSIFLANRARNGGAIHSSGKLFLDRTYFRMNEANEHGGAVFVWPAGASGSSVLEISDSMFEHNSAARRGGALLVDVGGDVSIHTRTLFRQNRAAESGGAMFIGDDSVLIMDDVIVQDNISDLNGGGIVSYANAELSKVTVLGNDAADGGGGIRNHRRMLLAESIVKDNVASKYGGILSDGIMVIEDSHITGNVAHGTAGGTNDGDGGGIFNGYRVDHQLGDENKYLRITGSVIAENIAEGRGGGIFSAQRLEVTDSTVDQNRSGESGGGIFTRVYASAEGRERGDLHLSGSTVSGNRAENGSGGGIAGVAESSAPTAVIWLENSTISGNIAAVNGAGIYLRQEDTNYLNQNPSAFDARLWHVTIVANEGEGAGAGAYFRYSDVKLRGTIMSGNTSTRQTVQEDEYDLATHDAAPGSEGYNWIGSQPQALSFVPGPTDSTGTPATLGPLTDNGGPTKTHAVSTSQMQVVPAAECTGLSGDPLERDQRGEPRHLGSGGRCFIGAVEMQ